MIISHDVLRANTWLVANGYSAITIFYTYLDTRRPVSNDELEREKLNATLALPGKFATAQAALGQSRSLVYYGLPLDYFNTYAEHVNKVTEAEVKTRRPRT